MARRRKNEPKSTTKSPSKFVAVRKSSRQIAKKQQQQLEEKKVNGEILQTSQTQNDVPTSEECHGSQDQQPRNQSTFRSLHSVHKKFGKYRCTLLDKESSGDAVDNSEDVEDNSVSIASLKQDANESDSQDDLENVLATPDKLSPEDVREVVVGNSNEAETVPNEACVWQEDVIEETIICEEMEVEPDGIDANGYTIDQHDGSVVIEQVLLVDEPDYEGKGVVGFAVIQNEDGTESMVMANDRDMQSEQAQYAMKKHNSLELQDEHMVRSIGINYQESSKEYQLIHEGVSSLHVSEDAPGSNSPRLENSVGFCTNSDNDKSNEATCDFLELSERPTVLPRRRKPRFARSDEIIPDNSTESCLEQRDDSNSADCVDQNQKHRSQSKFSVSEDNERVSKCEAKVNSTISKIDSNLAIMQIRETSKQCVTEVNMEKTSEGSSVYIEKSTSLFSSSSSSASSPSSSSASFLREDNVSPMSERPVNNPQDRMCLSGLTNDKNLRTKNIIGNERKRVTQAHSHDVDVNCINTDQEKSADQSQTIEELSRDSEMDGNKVDSEDIKLLSSSSENSNDTLLSGNSCKLSEEAKLLSDSKNLQNNQQIESDKKTGFRSRSGSTDTTGSESGSNSSGIRRSSRIRSIGLMKQRSRGRGLVTKPSIDLSKTVFQQERDKNPSTSMGTCQESKDNSDNQSETQSDRESNGTTNKNLTSFDSLTPPPTILANTGYDSDSSKPVKVKSRWRRSSELEMGSSSSSGSLTAIPSGIGTCNSLPAFGLSTTIGLSPLVGSSSTAGCIATSLTSTGTNSTTSVVSETINSTAVASISLPNLLEMEASCESLFTTGNSSVASSSIVMSKVGTKIPLPMVPEMKDREMEERLSQFEHLKENLYLTERYTNKETKRMVCDCFLTEEETIRGELGCGEDCLNRLLMIECGPRCVVGDRCTNKRFQNCEYAKCEVFRTEKKGFGLRAVGDMLAGEFIMEYVGEVVDPKDFRRRAKEYSKDKNKHYYFMSLKSDQIIDATMKGNVSRFINHSCDPNSETQKWTVNGELRIGFFNKKFIAAGEEITFDYHFQRYGKEAQKCYCEAPNCRGWIGDTPEEEKEKIEKKEKREKDVRKKKEEKKPIDYMEDEDLEEEIEKLCQGGLKNRAQTLTLSRLMVRSRELEHRTRLLRVIQSGEQPCRRLFLDYHGLRLVWSYMMDVASDDTEEARQFRLEILKTLNTLPIPNKTMLMDSKVYSVVEKWANSLHLSPNTASPDDEQPVKVDKIPADEPDSSCDSNEKIPVDSQSDIAQKVIKDTNGIFDGNAIKQETVIEQNLISEMASSLLAEWSNLKEVFRIPKKERIEQMKEHEREADRGYREDLDKEERRESSYDRHRSDRYSRNDPDKRVDRRRGRESPDFEHSRTKDKRTDERVNLVPVPRMTKFERRQLFALKVAKEEEERQRRQQQESWQEHEARCLALGMDPHTTATVDPQTGYPLFFNPSLGQWQPYPMQDGGEITQQCTPVYMRPSQPLSSHAQPGIIAQNHHVLPPGISPGIPSGIPPGVQSAVYALNQSSSYSQASGSYPVLPHHHQSYPEGQIPLQSNLVPIHNGTAPVPISAQSLYLDKPLESPFPAVEPVLASSATAASTTTEPAVVPPMDLPPKWKWTKDARGRVYYYHVKERISQWLPPPPDHIGVQPDSSSSEESSDDSSSSNEEEDEMEEERPAEGTDDLMELDTNTNSVASTSTANPKEIVALKKAEVGISSAPVFPEVKKRRDGLVQERIISPRREEDRMDHKKYKEIKDKLRRQKERAKLKEHVEKLRKHRRNNKLKSHSRHSLSKQQSQTTDASSTSERKIKDTFRINMANVMVHSLNPYRKNDCKQGRITNIEDFKHLARKLTHFVLAKELKHCKSVDELQCNENVKHKAKDFVRKYMSKFGAVYQKSTDED
ncbi:uncharacterized protein LOC107273288 isoform X2 [Cephus cinctus]|uniref:[histone H3]-lysine(36) N-trimethyltransferase n=1 Tax=Cephus cinctus TaxID=211228 RepID=A0AAJ7CBQ8_CEPCN|nr:uncharacterized protein LOC107273288 isoform X2 [Cephus cinctus]